MDVTGQAKFCLPIYTIPSIWLQSISAFLQWFEQTADILQNQLLIIWGAGIRGTIFSILLKERGFHNIKFVDSNPQKHGGCIDEFLIISPDDLKFLWYPIQAFDTAFLVMCYGLAHSETWLKIHSHP